MPLIDWLIVQERAEEKLFTEVGMLRAALAAEQQGRVLLGDQYNADVQVQFTYIAPQKISNPKLLFGYRYFFYILNDKVKGFSKNVKHVIEK